MATTFYNADWKEIQRTKCQKYSRVSGFITPVDNYNIGKKSEFYSRKFYSVEKSMNSKFIEDYSDVSFWDSNIFDIVQGQEFSVVLCCDKS